MEMLLLLIFMLMLSFDAVSYGYSDCVKMGMSSSLVVVIFSKSQCRRLDKIKI